MKSVLADRLFHLKENGTTVRRECFAGLTTFVTMAYILAVNPAILGAAGMDRGAVFTASALAACAATLLMALLSNYPFALAPGMGLNAYFAYTVVIKQGYSWQMALAAVFLEGLLFIVLSVTSVREAIFNSIPRPLKLGVTWGIGLFILFIGLQNSKLIVADPSTMLSVYPFREAIASGEIRSVGLGAVLAFAGILLTAILTIRRVKGALLLGILAVWGAAILCQLTGLYVPNAELGMASVLPDFSAGLAVPSLAPTFMQMDFTGLFTLNFLTVVLSFLFVDVFDTLGGIIGMASQGHMLDENGRLPRIRGALLSDAVGTSVGAVLGTSTTTTFAESAAGIAAGGRTGLTSVVTALMFLLSLFLSPLFLAVPGFATAPALVIVGLEHARQPPGAGPGGLAGEPSRLSDHGGHALLLLHLRGHCRGHHLLCGRPPLYRRGEPEEGQPRAGGAGRTLPAQVHIPVRRQWTPSLWTGSIAVYLTRRPLRKTAFMPPFQSKGWPLVTTTSASLPGVRVPTRLERPAISAALLVMAARASSGSRPPRTAIAAQRGRYWMGVSGWSVQMAIYSTPARWSRAGLSRVWPTSSGLERSVRQGPVMTGTPASASSSGTR